MQQSYTSFAALRWRGARRRRTHSRSAAKGASSPSAGRVARSYAPSMSAPSNSAHLALSCMMNRSMMRENGVVHWHTRRCTSAWSSHACMRTRLCALIAILCSFAPGNSTAHVPDNASGTVRLQSSAPASLDVALHNAIETRFNGRQTGTQRLRAPAALVKR